MWANRSGRSPKINEWGNCLFFLEQIAHSLIIFSLIFLAKTSYSLRKPMSEFPTLQKETLFSYSNPSPPMLAWRVLSTLAPDPVAPWSKKSCRILPFLAPTVQHLYLRQPVDSCGAIYQKQPLCTVQWCQSLFMWLNVPEKAFYGANPESCGTLYLRQPVEWCVSWLLWHPVPETAWRMVPILAPVAPCTWDSL